MTYLNIKNKPRDNIYIVYSRMYDTWKPLKCLFSLAVNLGYVRHLCGCFWTNKVVYNSLLSSVIVCVRNIWYRLQRSMSYVRHYVYKK